MTEIPHTTHRFPWKKRCRAKTRPTRVSFEVEVLEDRITPSYFPSTTTGIHVLRISLMLASVLPHRYGFGSPTLCLSWSCA